MNADLSKETHSNRVVDVDGLLMHYLDSLPAYDAVRDKDYCKLHSRSLDVLRCFGLARILLWLAANTPLGRFRSDH